MGPAGEWLLDNLHVLQEHIFGVRESPPRSYCREPPQLARRALTGYPCVQEIAIVLMSHAEARVELDGLSLVFIESVRRAPSSEWRQERSGA